MGPMQVLLTLMLVFLVVVITSTVQPFSDELKQQNTLQSLEMASLMAIFLTLWAASVFYTFPKCEDPQRGQGKTLAWCNFLSVTVGLTNFIILLTLVVYFLSVKFSGKGAGEVIATSRIGKRVSTFWESKRHSRGGAKKTKKGETKTDKEVAAVDIELTSVVTEEATGEDDEQEKLTAIFADSSGDSSGGEVEEEEWESLVDPDTGKV
jgi:hypothetical protein